MSHTFIAHSALGDALQFRRLDGQERMGKLFEFTVDLLSENQGIDPKSLLGTDLTVEMDLTTETGGGGTRYLSGQVLAFDFTGRDGDYYSYRATLQPWLSLAQRRTDFKIFQNKTVPDIVEEVLAPYGFEIENRLCNTYRTWVFLVQYGESDFNFISRLLEHEGAYYYFEHSLGSHKLVLADDLGSHSPLPQGPTTIPYYPGNRAAHVHDEDYIAGWKAAQDVASGKFAADDYDFEKPQALLDTHRADPAGHSQDSYEVFHYPGGYTDLGDGENYARVRMEQLKAERQTVQGTGNARNLAPGYLFDLSKYPREDQNQQYLIVGARYEFTENVQRSDGAGGSGGADTPTTYRIDIHAVPSTVVWHSQSTTEKPRTTGPQTAVVTGPAGEEIYTDKYGRVKLWFRWDRYNAKDENSSCWIRVSQTWAGSNYGTMHIPRIGQEVIVDFLDGDPDYPMVTGRVYNAMQMPPWDLPANKTQSGIKTRSSKGGTPGDGMKNSPGTANAIRFEDLSGQEQLWFHAQKDQLTEVEHNEDKWVGNDRNKTIDGNETNTIHKNRTETVDLDETITIHGNRTETVDKNEDVTIHQNRTKTIDIDETDTIRHNWDITVGGSKTETVALTYMETTGIAKVMTVGMAYSRNVGLVMNALTGIMQAGEVGVSKQLLVGQDYGANVGKSVTLDVGESKTETVGKVSIHKTGEYLELVCGGAKIVLTSAGGIYLQGAHIELQGKSAIHGDAGVIEWNCEAAQSPPGEPGGESGGGSQ